MPSAQSLSTEELISATLQHLELLQGKTDFQRASQTFRTPENASGTLEFFPSPEETSDGEDEGALGVGQSHTVRYLTSELDATRKSLKEEWAHRMALEDELRTARARLRAPSPRESRRNSQADLRMKTLENEWQYQETQIENLQADLNHARADLVSADRKIDSLQRLIAPIYLYELAKLRAASVKSWSKSTRSKSEDLNKLTEKEIESALADFVDLPVTGEELDREHQRMFKSTLREGLSKARDRAQNPTEAMINDGLEALDLGIFVRPYVESPFARKSLLRSAV